MCIAIYKPANKSVSKEILKECYSSNKDGCGFAYINTDNRGISRLKVKKSLSFDTFYSQYKRAITISPESPFLIHFRIKTHGPIDTANCHPFKVDKNHVFVHNGVIKGMRTTQEESDTNRFNKDYLQRLPKGWMQNEGVLSMIEYMVDYGKIVLMNIDGDVQICNEKKGEWSEGVWYSNTSYKKITYHSSYRWGSTNVPARTTDGRANSTFLNSSTKDISQFSWEICSMCRKPHQIRSMIPFYRFGRAMIYCKICADKHVSSYPNMEGYELPPQCYVDYLNEAEDGASYKSKWYQRDSWENPWDKEGTTAENQEEIDNYYDSIEEDTLYHGPERYLH